jgi:hypothetical protein
MSQIYALAVYMSTDIMAKYEIFSKSLVFPMADGSNLSFSNGRGGKNPI